MSDKKVLYLGVYRDGTGYGNLATQNILAMDSVGIDVVPRSITMTGQRVDPPDRIVELEKKDIKGCNVVVTNNIPTDFEYVGGVDNIGLFCYEVDGRSSNDWVEQAKTQDKLVFLNDDETDRWRKLTNKPTFTIPAALDTSKLGLNHKYKSPINLCEFNYRLLWVGESNKRKNLSAALIAYFTAFDIGDNVILVVKSNGNISAIEQQISNIKKMLNIYTTYDRYPKVVIMCDHLTQDELYGLYQECDALICSSYGESFHIPSAEMAGLGKHVFAPCFSALKEHTIGYESSPMLCIGVDNPITGIYNRRGNSWFHPSTQHLSYALADAFKNRHSADYINHTNRACEFVLNNFSYNAVGKKWLEVINAETK